MKRILTAMLAIALTAIVLPTTTADAASLRAPTNVRIDTIQRSHHGTVMLRWNKVSGAAGYNIYQDGNYLTTVNGGSTLSRRMATPTSDWSFYVTAFDSSKQRFSGKSQSVTRPHIAVSMGDSYISGTGGQYRGNGSSSNQGSGTYGNSGRCYRSSSAELLSARLPVLAYNIACSGAVTSDLRPGSHQYRDLQWAARNFTVDMVVVSIGGNDANVSEFMAYCVKRSVRRNSCDHRRRGSMTNNINAIRPRVETVLRDIKTAVGQHRGARIVLQSYISPLPSSNGYNSGKRIDRGCSIQSKDLRFIHDYITPLFDSTLRTAADRQRVEFLSLKSAFDGNALCERGKGSSNEWVTKVRTSAIDQSFHPNYYGQRALGACLRGVWNANGHRYHKCTNTGSNYGRMRITH